MNDITTQAAENLRVIRELMERSTVYRTISAPVAVFGGGIAIAVAAVLLLAGSELAPGVFISVWLAVYLITDGFHAFMLWRNHQKTGDPFLSPKMVHAILLLTPPMLAGGIVGILAGLAPGSLPLAAIFWAIFYGLSLLATFSFSPRSITLLGGLFLAAGLLLLVSWHLAPGMWIAPQVATASWIMGGTFGLFHLVYGVAVRTSSASVQTTNIANSKPDTNSGSHGSSTRTS